MVRSAKIDISSTRDTMVAYRSIPGKPQLETIPVPSPGPHEVLVEVLVTGVCHCKLHMLDWSHTPPFAPHAHTRGHENSAIVVHLGSALTADPSVPSAHRLASGTYIGVLVTNHRGLENVCWTLPMTGLSIDGYWAEAAGFSVGQTILVFGCGGLGNNAIQIAKHDLGEAVVVGSHRGADYTVLPGEIQGLLAEKKLASEIAGEGSAQWEVA
ncbi:chaperonin 10-like protein [Trametes elegans]|nr:chaperonin 10-like protein [Trametes elegans]